MAKASCLILAGVLLCSAILLFSSLPPRLHSLRSDRHPLYAPPSPAYKSYIVILRGPPGYYTTMDDNARLRWYQSFLPSNPTDSGQPRMTQAYKVLFPGFAAWLTETELEAMSKKPGFGSWLPDTAFPVPSVED